MNCHYCTGAAVASDSIPNRAFNRERPGNDPQYIRVPLCWIHAKQAEQDSTSRVEWTQERETEMQTNDEPNDITTRRGAEPEAVFNIRARRGGEQGPQYGGPNTGNLAGEPPGPIIPDKAPTPDALPIGILPIPSPVELFNTLSSHYQGLLIALEAEYMAKRRAAAAQEALKAQRRVILNQFADNAKNLGSNEAARAAVIDNLCRKELADVTQAEATQEDARFGTEVCRLRVRLVEQAISLAELAARR